MGLLNILKYFTLKIVWLPVKKTLRGAQIIKPEDVDPAFAK